MIKSEIRKKYKVLRQELSEDQIEDKSLAIANKLLQLNIWQHSFYHIFLPAKMFKIYSVLISFCSSIGKKIW